VTSQFRRVERSGSANHEDRSRDVVLRDVNVGDRELNIMENARGG
jgi:hypothetical protein